MTEKDLIGKIRELRQIQPRKDWVILTKSQILGEEKAIISDIRFLQFFKPAFAGLIAVFILFGLFGFAQSSLPGDLLYPLKKITEKSRVVFVSEEERPGLQLELVNKRLEDLTKIAEANRVRNLSPAISEFQENLSQAARNLVRVEATTSDPGIIQGIVKQAQKIEVNKQKVEALGIVIGETEELDNALAQLVEREIEDLEGKTLTENQQKLLEEAIAEYQAGNYSTALEKILFLSYPQF